MDYEFFCGLPSRRAFCSLAQALGAARRYAGNRTDDFGRSEMFRAELAAIDTRHGRKRWANVPLKVTALGYSTIGYLLQGDWKYAVGGIVRRAGRGQLLSGKS